MTEERILDFLDGNLGASEEEELLHRLAVSPERRALLKQHLQMRELTASLARRQYTPVPKVLTAALFTSLAANGYSGPEMPVSNVTNASFVTSLEQAIPHAAESLRSAKYVGGIRRSALIAASVISFVAGAALVYFIVPPERDFASKIIDNPNETSKKVAFVLVPAVSSSVQSEPSNFENTRSVSSIGKTNTQSVRFSKRSALNNSVHESNSVSNENVELANTTTSSQSSNLSANEEMLSFPAITKVDIAESSQSKEVMDIGGGSTYLRNPFDRTGLEPETERSFWQRTTLSLRAGEGKAPGNQQALTGSLIELKASTEIGDWLTAKVSLGQFMPYETIASPTGFNGDGFRLLKLSSVMLYRIVVGAEVGGRFKMFNAPFEATAGFISDLQGGFVPRAGLFTSLMLQDDLSMNFGLEGMLYNHDILSSLRKAQGAYSSQHPSLVGQTQSKESTGFVGPAIELVWHF